MFGNNLKTNLRKLINDFKTGESWNNSEEHNQTLFTSKLLDILGYSSSNIRINQGQEVKTGKKPDILLLNDIGNTLFVIESKEASKKDILDGKYQTKTFIEQLHGYCKAEGIQWGILTNFVEWRVYSIYQNRLYKERKYAFHDLLWQNANKSDYIDLLSDEGFEFFNRLSKTNLVNKKGRWDEDTIYYPKQEEIKEKFFQDLKKWRTSLRSHISKNYDKKYSIDTIDLLTQKILDRLIFIDYCADNSILTQDRLHAILYSKENLYKELRKIFLDMDEKFNSELFSKSECDELNIDDDTLRPIIIELSNIDFSRLSVHIIGEVYENYLGELLKSGKKGIKVEEEKATQKKKSQGIYYTPDYIVDYIVSNTVGEILKKCKTVEEIEKIRVLDPACGSGSFLIRVFDEFLKHYERIDAKGMFQFETRKKILQNNIYGVDLDERAVEIAKLNLMIKALEGSASISLTGRKLLPNLKLNIRCGNSLISGELSEEEMGLFWEQENDDLKELKKCHLKFYNTKDDNEKEKIFQTLQVTEYKINSKLNNRLKQSFKNLEDIKPFNYSVSFPSIIESGGFDCIVGNPPYIRPHNIPTEIKKMLWMILKTFVAKSDIYSCFMEKCLHLTKPKGFFSFITPHTWTSLESFYKIRQFIINNSKIQKLVQLPKKVFVDATVETCIFVLEKKGKENTKKNNKITVEKIEDNHKIKHIRDFLQEEINSSHLLNFQLYGKKENSNLINKILNTGKPLEDFVLFQYGFKTADDTKFIHQIPKYKESKPFIRSRAINRYYSDLPTEYVWYVPQKMIENKVTARPGEKERFEQEKILVARMGKSLVASYDSGGLYVKDAMLLVSNKQANISLKYILGIINSKLMNYYYQEFFNTIDVLKNALLSLPIKPINFSDKVEMNNYNKIIELVDELIKLNGNEGSRQRNTIQIKSIDSEIDTLVYKLYGISREDVDGVL